MTKSFILEFRGYWPADNLFQVPVIAGVFCVYQADLNSEGTLIPEKLLYIGEAENLQATLLDEKQRHFWQQGVAKGKVLCFSVAVVPPEEKFLVEAALVQEHRPPLNMQFQERYPISNTLIFNQGQTDFLQSNFFILN